jgi:hypothetical protein
MAEFHGSLRLPGEAGPGLDVLIDLTGDRLGIRCADSLIGDWALSEVRVTALEDGFHLRAEGEEVLLDVTEDAQFAIAIGMRTAPPLLRRRMASLLREDA